MDEAAIKKLRKLANGFRNDQTLGPLADRSLVESCADALDNALDEIEESFKPSRAQEPKPEPAEHAWANPTWEWP